MGAQELKTPCSIGLLAHVRASRRAPLTETHREFDF